MNSIVYPQQLQKIPLRITAGLVWFFSSLALLIVSYNTTISFVLTLFLLYEFAISFLGFFRFSLFKILSEIIWELIFNKKEDRVYYRPKRFAKFCGTILLFFSIVFYLFNSNLYVIFLGMLAIFSFLEAFFNFCIACKIYYLAQKWKWISEDACKECK